MTQPIEKNGAGDGARTRDLRRDRPEGPLVVSSTCSENKAPECAGLSERAALAGLAMLALAGCGEIPASSYMITTDKDTGCQYISSVSAHGSNGIAPRIAADGKTHMGCSAPLPIPSERVM